METALYIVSTPIGNLKDITLRALEIFKEADFISCEDTRVTGFLLNHYEIKKELVSLNANNESQKSEYILNRINDGESCALVSDAGTPAISDPGIRLISAAIKRGINIVAVPGPSAVTAALTLSGLPTNSFVFEGFLPQKKGRQKKLKELSEEARTIVLYESTYRIEKLISELNEYMPGRLIVVCREITKKFEETWRGYPKDILDSLNEKILKGEFAIVLAPLGWEERS
ncbi:MAG TPA: 16S rRNA (cytidine(1402)-2'-O)-methyltransferase [Ignavibacteriaceae bacterium]|nr:16S rRNA (cytidine(1402)-2'-O)-methyltransferase [Ignavibacteriaceae bacterium]